MEVARDAGHPFDVRCWTPRCPDLTAMRSLSASPAEPTGAAGGRDAVHRATGHGRSAPSLGAAYLTTPLTAAPVRSADIHRQRSDNTGPSLRPAPRAACACSCGRPHGQPGRGLRHPCASGDTRWRRHLTGTRRLTRPRARRLTWCSWICRCRHGRSGATRGSGPRQADHRARADYRQRLHVRWWKTATMHGSRHG
jgi:hypothetical protein